MKRGLLLVFLLTWIANIGNTQVSKTQVGATYYDLQTNNSIERRIVIDPTSKKRIIVYTGSATNDASGGAFSDRGTGYYYYSGVGPMAQQVTFPPRLEDTIRVGWPNPLFLKNGKEMVISHQSASGYNGLYSVSRTTAGTGTWIPKKVSAGAQTWPRAVNSGDSILVISSVFSDGNASLAMYGMYGGIGYKRSFDGGLTWTPNTVSVLMDSIPGINENKYINVPDTSKTTGIIKLYNQIGGDRYALDARGNMIAVLTGHKDVTLFISTDFGNSWTMQTVLAGDNSNPAPSDLRSGGDFSVLIDNNNKIHCFWGLTYGNGNTFEPDKAGIVYWNNVTTGMKPKVIYKTSYGLEDNPNAMLYLPQLTQLRYTNPTTSTSSSQLFYGSGYTCNPSSGIDTSNTIYLSYQRTRGINDTNRFNAGKILDGNGNLLNDCYVVKSTDNGATWLGPINVSNSDSTEEAYPSIARFVDDSVHIVYQQDAFAGAFVNDVKSAPNLNKVIYARVAVNGIVNPKDVTPPVLLKKQNVDSMSSFAITDTSDFDTLKMLAGCKLESTFNDTFTNITSYLKKNLIRSYDDNDSVIIVIDTPTNFNINTPGTYNINIRAKDPNNNYSVFRYLLFSNGLKIYSWDTLKVVFVVSNTDNIPPIITMTKKTDYIKVGTPYSLPQPLCDVRDNNPCSPTPSPTLPSASQVDVNKIGVYNLIVTATDLNNNKATDTLKVYVGDSPNSSFTNEAVTTTKLSATGTTPDIDPIFPNTGYNWKTKTKNGQFVNSLPTTKDLVYTITSSTLSFDSLCYEVKNVFINQNVPNVKVKTTCKPLKYVKGSVGIQNNGNNAIKLEIAPNPNSGIFKIQYEGIAKVTEAIISIQDINGRTIYNEKITVKGSGEIPVRLTNINNGTYFINTQIGENSFMRKLEISK